MKKRAWPRGYDTVITSHRNADYDAIAAIIAAARLYPDSWLVFPGSQEKQLQYLYDDCLRHLYNFTLPKDVDLTAIRRLVVVDTSQAERLAHVEEILALPDIEIHIWDHHPELPNLPNIVFRYVEPVGSTSAILTEEIQRRGLKLGCEDATLIGLGIYGDTGSFNYTSTTERDFAAAAHLLRAGMDTTFITGMLHYELSREQLRTLNELLDTAEVHDLTGKVLVIATAHLEEYLNDFAVLAAKFSEFQPYDIFFGLGSMEDKIQVVARSRIPNGDVGAICKLLGGGGHISAASAAVKNKTIPELKDFILGQFSIQASQDKTAGRLMSSPAVGIEAHSTIREAAAVMSRYGFKAMPVLRSGTKLCEGWLEHQLAVKAISHNLGDVPVTAYMQPAFRLVTRGDSLQTLMDIIVGNRQRLVPVVEGPDLPDPYSMGNAPREIAEQEASLKSRPLVGVVTRTDLIRTFADDDNSQLPKPRNQGGNKRNLNKSMRAHLAQQDITLLEMAGRLGDRLGIDVFVVGGFVRDLLLAKTGKNWPGIDIDLVIEGDAETFASLLAKALHGRVSVHKEFMTAAVVFPASSVDGTMQTIAGESRDENPHSNKQKDLRLDIASARLEYYSSPASLPTVELSSLKMDLYRRDFTINAMAVQLNSKKFGQLQDFFDGQIDIRQKRIRVLHALSFVEDPTRAIRAVRFEQRYNFQISQQTERLIRNALDLRMFDRLSGKRILHELNLVLGERRAIRCFVRMHDLGILAAVNVQLELPPWKMELLDKTLDIVEWHRQLYLPEYPDLISVFLLTVCRNSTTQQWNEIMEQLELPPKKSHELLGLRFLLIDKMAKLYSWHKTSGRLSQLYDILKDVPLEGLLFLAARMSEPELHKQLTLYIYKGRRQTPDISGRDLQGLGLIPGPIFQQILRKVLAAKLDGLAPTREVQLELAAELALQWKKQLALS